MGDFVTNSQTSLATLYDHCDLLKNVLHDVLRLEVGDKLDHVRVIVVTADACMIHISTRCYECVMCTPRLSAMNCRAQLSECMPNSVACVSVLGRKQSTTLVGTVSAGCQLQMKECVPLLCSERDWRASSRRMIRCFPVEADTQCSSLQIERLLSLSKAALDLKTAGEEV